MAYEKQTWVDYIIAADTGEVLRPGTTITAERLNHMEDGIAGIATTFEDFTADSEGVTLKDVETSVQDLNQALSSVQTAIDTKVTQVAGKGLSTNDFTTALKEKLDGQLSPSEITALLNRLDELEQWKASVLAGTTAVVVDQT